ncbi:hypothetical protein LX32DRAFT_637870 [Colletotrichum zoysiae]|uniref:Uncharacterized protein n=1 Tax=Colletotrichum zoysiae TaxID=1216348 RepID=A0AAD9HM69_9PEZI|nr:hypothetical protein LX32DRAFT_637870 [Colletotrichum zoysiae]
MEAVALASNVIAALDLFHKLILHPRLFLNALLDTFGVAIRQGDPTDHWSPVDSVGVTTETWAYIQVPADYGTGCDASTHGQEPPNDGSNQLPQQRETLAEIKVSRPWETYLQHTPPEGISNPSNLLASSLGMLPLRKTFQPNALCCLNTFGLCSTDPPLILMRIERDLAFHANLTGRPTAVVTSRTFIDKMKSKDHHADTGVATQAFIHQFRQLDRIYEKWKNISNWTEIVTLQYYHTNLLLYAQFLLEYDQKCLEPRRLQYDPRRFKVKEWHMRSIVEDAYRLNQFRTTGNQILTTIEALADIAGVAAKSVAFGPPSPQDGPAEAESTTFHPTAIIIFHCREVKAILDELDSNIENDLKLLNLSREIGQTNSVKRLTLLATIFLPLSLAAGILSMQTRFRDLGVLIYDFFGVVVISLAFLFLILLGLTVYDFVTGRLDELEETRPGGNPLLPRRTLKASRRLTIVTWAFLAAVGLFILASFVIGMFKDTDLGAKILGIGMAVILGIPYYVVCILLVLRTLKKTLRIGQI